MIVRSYDCKNALISGFYVSVKKNDPVCCMVDINRAMYMWLLSFVQLYMCTT